MLSKVREQGRSSLYEVVEYDHKDPCIFVVNTLNKEDFKKTLSENNKDYYTHDDFLVSSAETVNICAFPEGKLTISNVNETLFLLLIDLIAIGAYYIPDSLYSPGVEYKGEMVSHFSNIRVSNSTMFAGFSILVNGEWRTFSILTSDSNGYLVTNPFYVAVPQGKSISFNLKRIAVGVVNNVVCDIYYYSNTLPIYPYYDPIDYIPSPVLNYLFYHQNKFKNAIDFISIFLERDKVETSPEESRPVLAKSAIKVIPSIKPTPKDRCNYLINRFLKSNLTLDELILSERLNVFEQYTFRILMQLSPEQLLNDIPALIFKLKVERNRFALLLMELRCKIFISDLVIPPMFDSVIAQGGCYNFHTTLKRVGR